MASVVELQLLWAGTSGQDIVLAIDDRPILGLPDFIAALYLHPADQVLIMDLLRGTNRVSLKVPVAVYHEKIDELADIPELHKSLIRKLSIFVTELDGSVKQLLHDARSDSGVVVVAQAAGTKWGGYGAGNGGHHSRNRWCTAAVDFTATSDSR